MRASEIHDAAVETQLAASLLEGEPQRRFAAARRRIVHRYAGWRTNFPSFAVLLDSEAQRAEALAGNYATESDATLQAWAEAQVDAAVGGIESQDLERLAAWIDTFLGAWRRAARRHAGVECLPEVARSRFDETLDDLLARSRVAALERLSEAARPHGDSRVPWLRALTTAPRAVLGWLRRFFFPGRSGA